jgi:hypothetical protein
VLRVGEHAPQGREPVVRQGAAARPADQVAEREDVRHARADPQLERPRRVRRPVVPLPGEAVRHARPARELEQPLRLGREPRAVRRPVGPIEDH